MESTKYCIIFNPLSGNGKGKAEAEALCARIDASACIDMTKIEDYSEFFADHTGENIVICGGDGTLNRFVNDTAKIEYNNSIYYCAGGSGNDFLRDIDGQLGEIICIDKYIEKLPVCSVNGGDYKFINGIGFGLAGYCCEEGDRLRKTSTKPINYVAIAIKGMLYKYRPTSATVTVDGVSYRFKKVWTAPSMHGKFFGGGMMATPEQNRLNEEGLLSTMIFHSAGRLGILTTLPSIFQGEHVKAKKMVTILTGKEITVEYDSPRSLQIDGETITGVKTYTVKSCIKVKQEATV